MGQVPAQFLTREGAVVDVEEAEIVADVAAACDPTLARRGVADEERSW
jgi:hypothetical protein